MSPKSEPITIESTNLAKTQFKLTNKLNELSSLKDPDRAMYNDRIEDLKLDLDSVDEVMTRLGIHDLFMYFIFIPTTLVFIYEFDTLAKLTKLKKMELLDQLSIYEHREINSEKELFLIFDISRWL